DGGFIADFDGSDSPGGAFAHIEDVATGAAGAIFVADAQGGPAGDGNPSRVERFDGSGAHQVTLRPPASNGDGRLAFDPGGGNLIVGDVRANSPRVHIVDPATGDRLGQILFPSNARLTSAAVDQGASGRLYVATDDPSCGGIPICQNLTTVYVLKPQEMPVPVVQAATDVGETAVTLHGQVDPSGSETTAQFELSTDGGSSWFGAGEVTPSPGSGTDPVDVSLVATNLQDDTGYLARLIAQHPGGSEVVSPTNTAFTTADIPNPVIAIDPPVVTGLTASLGGSVDPEGRATSYSFEYSTDGGGSWTNASEPQDAGSGTDPVSVSDSLSLTAATEYQVRLTVTGPAGVFSTAAESFSVGAQAPTVKASGAGPITKTAAFLNARINPNGALTSYYFEYGPDENYGSRVPLSAEQVGAGNQPVHVTRKITGLEPGSTVHFRAVAANANGVSEGDDRAFQALVSGGDRVYELVSAVDKNGGEVFAHAEPTLTGMSRAALGGDRFIYASTQPFGGQESSPSGVYSLAERTPDGWEQVPLHPAQEPYGGLLPGGYGSGFANEDLSKIALQIAEPGPVPGGNADTPDLYVFDTANREYSLTTSADNVAGWGHGNNTPRVIGSSPDMGHVLVQTEGGPSYSPDNTGWGGIYDATEGEVRYIGYDENENPFAEIQPPQNVTPQSLYTLLPGSRPYITSDGSAIVFEAEGNLWIRIDGTETRQITEQQPGVSAPLGSYNYSGLAKDDDTVLFTSSEQLTVGGGPGLYRYDISDDSLTWLVGNVGGVVGISDDAERIYYSSNVDAALHLWEDGTDVIVAGETNSGGPSGYSNDFKVTPDGEFAIFLSANQGLTDQDLNGGTQIFLYNAGTGEVECASCPTNGAPPTRGYDLSAYAGPVHYGAARNLSDDGRYVFFGDSGFGPPGVGHPDDVNGRRDAYVYDSHTNQLELLSTGKAGSDSYFVDASADGRTAFFTTSESLVGIDTDGRRDIYAAKVGGGIEAQHPPVPIPECGDDCQGAPTPAPDVDQLGTRTQAGPGNVRANSCRPLARRLNRLQAKLEQTPGKARKGVRKQADKARRDLRSCRGGSA
ncbi:MAG: hypothetical protein QOE75_2868, partial [Solirubrobacterales bacterium]|nr:hypothetical protein [Solirubrobacterales bacterium]